MTACSILANVCNLLLQTCSFAYMLSLDLTAVMDKHREKQIHTI